MDGCGRRHRRLEGDAATLPLEIESRAGRSVPSGSGREVPPDVLDSIRGLNGDQLVNMLTNYYHSIRGESSHSKGPPVLMF